MAVCSKTDLPLAWRVETAKAQETPTVGSLLDALHARGITPETAAMDMGYDNGPVYQACAERHIRPIIPLKQTPAVKRGEHKPPCCEHGQWRFAGSDEKRGATKWRCPTGECKPASVWVKADRLHPLIPRETLRWKALYRRRAGVERAFGRLKNEWALAPLRVRRIERVRLHAKPHDPRAARRCVEQGTDIAAGRIGRVETSSWQESKNHHLASMEFV